MEMSNIGIRDRDILRRYYIERETLEEIGKEHNITSQCVRILRDKAIRKILDSFLGMTRPGEFSRLPTRARNALERAGIKSWEQLATMTAREMMEYRECGKTTLNELKRGLNERGLHFKIEPQTNEAQTRTILSHAHAIINTIHQ